MYNIVVVVCSLKVQPYFRVYGPVDTHEIFHLLQNWQIIFIVIMMLSEILEYIKYTLYKTPIFSCSVVFKHNIIPCTLVGFLPAKMSATDILPPNFLLALLFLTQKKKNNSTQLMTKMKTLLYSRNHNFLSCVMNIFFLGGLPTSLPASAEVSLPQNYSPLITLSLPSGLQDFVILSSGYQDSEQIPNIVPCFWGFVCVFVCCLPYGVQVATILGLQTQRREYFFAGCQQCRPDISLPLLCLSRPQEYHCF